MTTPESPADTQAPTAGAVLETLLRTSHQLHRQFETELAQLGVHPSLTGPRLRFLVTVMEAGSIRMSEIAAKLGIQPRTVTQFVDALEQEHLLIRTPDPKDRRATFLQLSDSAPPLVDQARRAMSASAENVLAHLRPEERGLLLDLLRRASGVRDGEISCE